MCHPQILLRPAEPAPCVVPHPPVPTTAQLTPANPLMDASPRGIEPSLPPQQGPSRPREGGPVASTAPLIQWTAHGQPASIQHMRIDHRRLHICVTQEFLHRPD